MVKMLLGNKPFPFHRMEGKEPPADLQIRTAGCRPVERSPLDSRTEQFINQINPASSGGAPFRIYEVNRATGAKAKFQIKTAIRHSGCAGFRRSAFPGGREIPDSGSVASGAGHWRHHRPTVRWQPASDWRYNFSHPTGSASRNGG